MNFFSSQNRQANQTKPHWLLAFSLSLMLITQTAHADFRKALEAYQKRDGTTMLKEVKDAVDKKNDDGLILFLNAMNIDGSISAKRNLYEYYAKESKDKKPPIIKTILTAEQFLNMLELLIVATNNSPPDANYLLVPILNSYGSPKQLASLKTTEQLAESGSIIAIGQMLGKYLPSNTAINPAENKQNYDYWRTKFAEAGSLDTQLSLGFKYLNFEDDYGCQKQSTEPICLKKDEAKGYYYLKIAAKNIEASGHLGVYVQDQANSGTFASKMCEFFGRNANGNKTELRQAYLWCLMGANVPGGESRTLLNWMHKRGELKIVAPEIEATWDESKRNAIFERTNLIELPDLIAEARKKLAKEDTPIFTYFEDDYMGYELDVFADGRVKIGFNNGYWQEKITTKVLLMEISPKTVNKFIVELKKTGINDWPSITQGRSGYGCVDNFDNPNSCKMSNYQLTLRDGITYHRKYLTEFQSVPIDNQSATYKHISKIVMLIEKYFPTQQLRCEIGSSRSYKQACLERDNQLKYLAKKGN